MASTSQRPPVRKAGSAEETDRTKPTYHGFIEDAMDALFVVQGTILGTLSAFVGTAEDMAKVEVRSGTVIVMAENNPYLKRWRDGLKWSPSRAYGPFILYREIEAKGTNLTQPDEDLVKDIVALSGHTGSTTGLLPSFSERTLKPDTQLRKDGLTKRTISVNGSDGISYRVVAYYKASDVLSMMASERTQDLRGSQLLPNLNGDNTPLSRPSQDNQLKLLVENSGINMTKLIKSTLPEWKPERQFKPRRNAPQVSRLKVNGMESPENKNLEITGSSSNLKPSTRTQSSTHDQAVTNLYTKQYFETYHPYHPSSESYDEYVTCQSHFTRHSEFNYPKQEPIESHTFSRPSSNFRYPPPPQPYYPSHYAMPTGYVPYEHFEAPRYDGYSQHYDNYGRQTPPS
ncbi:hypothetical protein HDU79_005845 [Rhizoclosmatium sp. JEL0117]|nr:hypothetical protein HDU79_005845 [Rhizoclosmatium sp. JEL0117]